MSHEMTAELVGLVAPLVQYHVTDAQIAAARAKCEAMTCDTRLGYELVRIAIADLRETRVAIEARRVELKKDALEYGRKVDSEAKRITGLLTAIEDPLKAKKQAVDDERERVKRATEDAKREALEAAARAEVARLKAEQDAENERLRVEREVETRRLAEERAALDAKLAQIAAERAEFEASRERQRQADEAIVAEARRIAEEKARVDREALEAERRQIADEQRATQARILAEQRQADADRRAQLEAEELVRRLEREALEAERQAVLKAREEADRIEFERQARITAEREAREQAEREQVEALERAARLAALQPDLEKVRLFARAILGVVELAPTVKDAQLHEGINHAVEGLRSIAASLAWWSDGV